MAYNPIQGMESVVASVSGYNGLEPKNLIKLRFMTYAGALSRSNSFTHFVGFQTRLHQGMEPVVASVSGYSRLEPKNLIKLQFMTYAGALSRSNSFTHLVCWKFEGRKYELANEFKMIVDKHRWIEDCREQGKMVPEHPFTLKRRD